MKTVKLSQDMSELVAIAAIKSTPLSILIVPKIQVDDEGGFTWTGEADIRCKGIVPNPKGRAFTIAVLDLVADQLRQG
ncbi:hypothetical protein CMI37_37485 [Candidatus Pacearchaeota archaeon]|nr:hypothetical protein [Candidatus Pacearchaeota archaeon]|tara:strand:+ start:1767 stop:2000 length:234 start_codon:yes stop_codon:yes gene_type:complete